MVTLFWFSILSAVGFAFLTVLLMIPMKWPEKRRKIEAIVAAGIERFIIGFVVCQIQLINPKPVNALVLGIAMSLPSAIISRNYIPIIAIGGAGSLLIGFLNEWLVK